MNERLSFKINGVEYQNKIKREGVSVQATPIVGRAWTDYLGGKHDTVLGTEYKVTVQFNPMSYSDAQTLFTTLSAGRVTLLFNWPGSSSAVSKSMRYSGVTLDETFKQNLCNGTKVTFVEG